MPDEPPYDPDYDTARNDYRAEITRLPPQDIAAERTVLGAALLDPTTVDKCATIITGADFYKPAHETIWRALTWLHASGNPTDATAVVGHLRDQGELRRTGGPEYVHELMANAPMTAGDALYHAHTVDKLSRQRAAIVVYERGLQQLYKPGGDVDDVLNSTTTDLVEARDNLANPTGKSTWASLDLTAVLEGKELDPPPTMLARNDGQLLLYAGAVHTVSGEPESGKTWLMLLAAVQELDAGNRVTMIDFEDRASRVVGRLLALGAHPEQIHDRFKYVRPHKAILDSTRPDLEQAITGSTLVILDGVTEAMTLHGLDLSSNPDVAKFYTLLPRWTADHGPAVGMIDHVVKDGEKQGRWGLGGQHKLAGIDGAAYTVKAIQPFGRGKIGHAHIRVSKDRPGYVEEAAVGNRAIGELWLDATNQNILRCDLRPSTTPPKGNDGQMRFTIYMEAVSKFIELNDGCLASDIYEGVPGHKKYITPAIEALARDEYIEREPGPRNSKFHRSVTPFRKDQEDPS